MNVCYFRSSAFSAAHISLLLLFCLSLCPVRIWAGASPTPPHYRVIDLGTLGGDESQASSINDHNQVVGSSEVKFGTRLMHGFLWEGGHLTALSLPPNAPPNEASSFAKHINISGEIVGAAVDGSSSLRPCLWRHKRITMLPRQGNDMGLAVGINANNQIVGYIPFGERHALLWDRGRVLDLGTLGGETSFAWSINDAGLIVGEAELPPKRKGTDHAFFWQKGKMLDLGTLGGDYSSANGINQAGQIVGGSEIKNGRSHAFLYDAHHGMRDMGVSSGFQNSRAIAINRVGQIVGFVWNGHRGKGVRHAFLWSHGRMQDLNQLILKNSGWSLSNAASINDRGYIVGSGLIKGREHAFLLIPVKVL